MNIISSRQYLLAICLAIGLIQSALAAMPAAEAQAVQYPAWLERNGKVTPLAPGEGLRNNDTVVSGEDSRVLLGLSDGSQIKLGSEGRFSIEKLSIQNRSGNTTVDASFKLLKGFFRYSSNALGKLTGKRNIDLKVSTATIGVRGTDYWAMTDAAHDAVCVFDGKVEVASQDQGLINLDQPTAFWTRIFDKPAQPAGNATPAELSRFIASVEPVPGNGVAIINGRWRIVAAAETTASVAQTIAKALRERGYPAEQARSYGRSEVRIDNFATRADAEATLKRLTAQAGLTGTEAKVVAAR